MDFIVSKVAMSICALLVVTVLSGVLGNNFHAREIDELKSALIDLSAAIESSLSSGCEETTIWRAPFLSNGESISVSASASILRASYGSSSAALKVACNVHTWNWNGTSLNLSAIERLDTESPAVILDSGQTIEIRTRLIQCEERGELFAFLGLPR